MADRSRTRGWAGESNNQIVSNPGVCTAHLLTADGRDGWCHPWFINNNLLHHLRDAIVYSKTVEVVTCHMLCPRSTLLIATRRPIDLRWVKCQNVLTVFGYRVSCWTQKTTKYSLLPKPESQSSATSLRRRQHNTKKIHATAGQCNFVSLSVYHRKVIILFLFFDTNITFIIPQESKSQRTERKSDNLHSLANSSY